MQPKIKIHFVCRGNVYRSRVAEAYAKSLKKDAWEISSSGIAANKYANRSLHSWARAIGRKHGFDAYFNPRTTQTTAEMLHEQDVIVFMRSDVFNDARNMFDFNAGKCLVWDIKDREDWPKQLSILQRRRRTFKHI